MGGERSVAGIVAKQEPPMNAWLETVGVVLIALGSALGGRWCSRLPRPWWTLGYFVPMVVVAMTSLARWCPRLAFVAPFSWLVSGRSAFLAIAMVTPMVLVTPLSRLTNRRLRVLVVAFLSLIVVQNSVLPFLYPALVRGQLLALETNLDGDGICLQGTDYTCGPAAAVTALRRLGLPAEEGELAVLAHTSQVAGTPPDLLAETLRRKYGADGLVCEYRYFDQVSDLKQPGYTLAVIKFSFLVDHYVTVLEVTDDGVIVGDPLFGRNKYPADRFEKIWRHSGVVLRKAANRHASAAN